jgi:hypothetical protein
VLVSRRQLMSKQYMPGVMSEHYMPGVKGVCVACQQLAIKICAFSSCSNPTCPPSNN